MEAEGSQHLVRFVLFLMTYFHLSLWQYETSHFIKKPSALVGYVLPALVLLICFLLLLCAGKSQTVSWHAKKF